MGDKPIRLMKLDDLFAVGNQQREQNYACGVPADGVNYLTRIWIDALVEHQGLSEVVADALRRRWMLPVSRRAG